MKTEYQLTLFDRGAYRRTDPRTSVAAAQSVEPAPLEALVLECLYRRPAGLTTHELADLLHLELVTVSPRMRPLASKGLVVDSGERRAGPSGRKSIVWRAPT
jgi:DNA-binding MarR family transcriptional regulator